MHMREGLMNWIMARKFRSLGFNEAEYDSQNALISKLEAEIELLQRSQNAVSKKVNNNKE